MALNNEKSIYNQLMDAIATIESLSKQVEKLLLEIHNLKSLNNELTLKNGNLEKKVLELSQEILRLKTNQDKDSSNSSKPSSTNGYKHVITNRRTTSTKHKGGQKGHVCHRLDNSKLEQMINSGNILHKIINVGKNKCNQNKPYKTVKIIDIKICKTIKELRYYPNAKGEYNIPSYYNNGIVYGENIKAIAVDLMYEVANSTDGVANFIASITNGGITLSKGTLIDWSNKIAQNLTPEIKQIEKSLQEGYYLNCDETSIKINSNSYNILCACNKNHTRLWASECKKHEDLANIGFLNKYYGVIVKDGSDIYNGFGIQLSQCISHILRYIKGVTDFIYHKYATKMAEFLITNIKRRVELLSKGITGFTEEELAELTTEYNSIFKGWKREWMSSYGNNPVYDTERQLLTRFEETDREQILYFLKDFKIPATNNQAEADQRPVKIKQKIGKFRSVTGAEVYAIIRSCINTYKKHNITVYDALRKAFTNKTIIV